MRVRHFDDTFARDAREQDFLRDAKEQLGLSGLLSHAGPIIDALSKSISSNIRGAATVAGLLETVIGSVNGPVHQVRFPNVPLDRRRPGRSDRQSRADPCDRRSSSSRRASRRR